MTRVLGRPTWVNIDLKALTWNFRQVRRLVGRKTRILAVVKANAYGHGAVACSRTLLSAGADELGVATVEEAEELRRAGIKQPIVIFGLIQPQEVRRTLHLDAQPTVVDSKQLQALNRAALSQGKTACVHLKVDTGMRRIGIQLQEVGKYLVQMQKYPGVKLRGMYTHFAHADGCDKRLVQKQMQQLKQACRLAQEKGIGPVLVHAANSAAVMDMPETYADMVRPGLMLYGLYPAQRFKKRVLLKPVLSWQTRIIQVKVVPAGTGISYGHTYITRRRSRIATLPVGYADGFSRLLSNCGRVSIKGKTCPIVGRVCMDMCLVDVTAIPGAAAGDVAIIIGGSGQRRLSADDMAKQLRTISYEVVCAIGNRVPRIFLGEKL